MDFKKVKAPTTTIPYDLDELEKFTGNIYETIVILTKRANQISVEMKEDLDRKLQDFISYTDHLEEFMENREQIEISRFYEKLPKPTAIAIQEYLEGKLQWRYPEKEDDFIKRKKSKK